MSSRAGADAARGHGVHGAGASRRIHRGGAGPHRRRSSAGSRRAARSRSRAAARAPTTSSSPRPDGRDDRIIARAQRRGHAPARRAARARSRRAAERRRRARARRPRTPQPRRAEPVPRARRSEQGAALVSVAREQAEAIAAGRARAGLRGRLRGGHRSAPRRAVAELLAIAEQLVARGVATRARRRSPRASGDLVELAFQIAEKIVRQRVAAEPERDDRRARARAAQGVRARRPDGRSATPPTSSGCRAPSERCRRRSAACTGLSLIGDRRDLARRRRRAHATPATSTRRSSRSSSACAICCSTSAPRLTAMTHRPRSSYTERVRRADPYRVGGRVAEVIGLVVESNGPEVEVGEMCRSATTRRERVLRRRSSASATGRTLLMPLAEHAGHPPRRRGRRDRAARCMAPVGDGPARPRARRPRHADRRQGPLARRTCATSRVDADAAERRSAGPPIERAAARSACARSTR